VSNLKPTIVKFESGPKVAIETTYENLSTTTALVIMNPYEAEALMRFTVSVSCNELSSKADTLIDTAASFNFVCKDFFMTNDFYKDCKTVPKQSIRVASEQRISTTKVFCSTDLSLMDMNSLTNNLES
jgi:hypothetical protein